MPGTSAGLNHSPDIQVCGRSRMPRACNSSFRAPTQSSSQVPSTLTLRLLRRCLSNCSSDSFSQAYVRRGIGSRSDKKRYQMVSQDAVGNNRQVFAACPCSVTRVGYGLKNRNATKNDIFQFDPQVESACALSD